MFGDKQLIELFLLTRAEKKFINYLSNQTIDFAFDFMLDISYLLESPVRHAIPWMYKNGWIMMSKSMFLVGKIEK